MGLRSAGGRAVAATFVTLGLVYGVWYAYSVFLVALLHDFGWSRSLLAGAFSVFALVHGLLSPGLGWLADRIGSRRLVLAGGVAAGLKWPCNLSVSSETPTGAICWRFPKKKCRGCAARRSP